MQKLKSLKSEAAYQFKALGNIANLPTSRYACTAEWVKDDRNRLHIVQRYEAEGYRSVILKFAQRPSDSEGFGRILDAHASAFLALSGSAENTVPEILAQDRAAQSYLMEFIAGDTVLNLCRNAPDHSIYLRKAGAWMAAFHRGTVQQERPFQPKFMVGHMQKLVAQMNAGERKINGQGQFIEYAKNIGSYAQAAEGHIGIIAAKHGDLNVHNILISDKTTAAIDFLGADSAPIAYDVARFLQSYTQMVGDISDIAKGQAVPAQAWAAFFDGYDLVSSDDPIIRFMTKVQLLTDWNRMQDKTSISGLLRLERVKKIAKRAFE